LRAAGASANHHDIALIANARCRRPGAGSRVPRPVPLRFEVGTIAGREAIGQRLTSTDAFVDNTDQPAQRSVHGRDPDGRAPDSVWRVPNGDAT
jgi:hypothetical protein